MTEGENDCGEWSSDDDSFNIGPNAPDVSDPESFTKSFTLKAYPKGDDSDVSFDVTGTYSVSLFRERRKCVAKLTCFHRARGQIEGAMSRRDQNFASTANTDGVQDFIRAKPRARC